ncbi:MAG TPA: PP2C family serine/threonine-protein phosphatase [Opitutus sp.]|nr:PP2C family serine/threonine-protein phosphatase [Opitutus sp.]
MTLLRSASFSDIGRVRRKNEDRFLCDDDAMIFGVADGVGGLPGGAEAAEHTVREIADELHHLKPGGDADLTTIVQRVNHRIRQLGATLSPAMGIGSTLTFGVVRAGELQIAHVGDSRCYVWHRGDCQQLTEDHSVENEARHRRARGETVFYHESNRNALTRCMGQPGSPAVDVICRPLRAGERYLFCTDGVTRLISNDELGALLGKPLEPSELLREIILLAVHRGGPDNATGVLVFVDEP